MSIGKYTGEAMATMEKIMSGKTAHFENEVYKNTEHNIFWYINKNGYLHVLRPCRVKTGNKVLYYAIEDWLLTKENKLRSKATNGKFDSLELCIEELEELVSK